jgi:ABC-type multidrug transport system fused ATPase/permease subunit
LIEEKEYDFGPVTLRDARKFLSFSAGIAGFALYFLVSIIVALLQLACSYILSQWAKQPFEEQQKNTYPSLLAGATAAYFLTSFGRALLGVFIINTSSKNMFRRMTNAVLRS